MYVYVNGVCATWKCSHGILSWEKDMRDIRDMHGHVVLISYVYTYNMFM